MGKVRKIKWLRYSLGDNSSVVIKARVKFTIVFWLVSVFLR